jgi:hypothetical protein
MPLEHEYALLGGYNRSHVGRWLGAAAALISAAVVFLVLSAVDLAKAWGLNVNLPPTAMSLIGAGAVYAALYWLFDRFAWKVAPLGRFLKVPNLSGKWCCTGTPLEPANGDQWTGTVTIVQSWDRLRIHIDTNHSTSDSLAAALQHDAAVGYRLMYHYRNQPKPGEGELAPHHGFAEMTFDTDETGATGDYFNGRGRNTFGMMTWKREVR